MPARSSSRRSRNRHRKQWRSCPMQSVRPLTSSPICFLSSSMPFKSRPRQSRQEIRYAASDADRKQKYHVKSNTEYKGGKRCLRIVLAWDAQTKSVRQANQTDADLHVRSSQHGRQSSRKKRRKQTALGGKNEAFESITSRFLRRSGREITADENKSDREMQAHR